jgi:hypothetical protein
MFAVIVVVYLAIIQIGGLLVTNAAGIDSDHGFVTTHNVLLSVWVPVGAALVFTFGVVAVLGWSRPVFRDDRPVQRWVLVVPIVFVICPARATPPHRTPRDLAGRVPVTAWTEDERAVIGRRGRSNRWHIRGSVATLLARDPLALFAGRMDAREGQAAKSPGSPESRGLG